MCFFVCFSSKFNLPSDFDQHKFTWKGGISSNVQYLVRLIFKGSLILVYKTVESIDHIFLHCKFASSFGIKYLVVLEFQVYFLPGALFLTD